MSDESDESLTVLSDSDLEQSSSSCSVEPAKEPSKFQGCAFGGKASRCLLRRTSFWTRRSWRGLAVAFSWRGRSCAAAQAHMFWRTACVCRVAACRCCLRAMRMKESMIGRCLLTSSSCTGAFTAEASLAVVEKTIRDSGFFPRPPSFRCISCYAPWMSMTRVGPPFVVCAMCFFGAATLRRGMPTVIS